MPLLDQRITTFFKQTKTLLAEAEQCIYVFLSAGQTWETVFILRGRRGERASELVSSDQDFEKANFHRNMGELSTHLTRLGVYFENTADYLNEHTVNEPAHQYKRLKSCQLCGQLTHVPMKICLF